ACGGVGGDCARGGAGAASAGEFVSAVVATASVAGAGCSVRWRAFVLDWAAERALAVAGGWLARSGARHAGHGGAAHPHPAGCAPARAADAGSGGGALRPPARAAHRAWFCPCAAVSAAVAWWRGRGGGGAGAGVVVDVEGHGREEVWSDIDLSRTVGWFTSLYPVRLDVGGVDVEEALAGGAGLGRALKLIKEQLRAVPGN